MTFTVILQIMELKLRIKGDGSRASKTGTPTMEGGELTYYLAKCLPKAI